MTDEMQWKCLLEGKAWKFMKLSAIILAAGLGAEVYLQLTYRSETFEEFLRLLVVGFWSVVIGMVGLGLGSLWFMIRGMTSCR